MDRQLAQSDDPRALLRQVRQHASPFGFGIILFGTLVTFDGASALTLEEAREKCRVSVGRPIVQACMRSHGYGGGRGHGHGMGGKGDGANPDKEAQREACRAQAHPQVHA
jgi:hypothetical protein